MSHETSSEMHRLHQKLERIEKKLEVLRLHAKDLDDGPGNNAYDQEYADGMRCVIGAIERIL